MKRYRVAVVGCGAISGQYLACLTSFFPSVVEVALCADLDVEQARRVATEYSIPRASHPQEAYEDPSIDIILNLTNPWAHAEVNLNALAAGKHVYAEKPLAMNREDAAQILKMAADRGLRIGCAPDTFLGAGLQTCRKLIDDGWIGTPLAAHAFIMMSHSTERYNSNRIGGALLDMAPYYVTALVHLLGPVRKVAGFAEWPLESVTIDDMRSASFGTKFPVEAPMSVCGTLEFDNGVIASLTTIANGFTYLPQFEVYGTDAHLIANDPNVFGGPVRLRPRGSDPFEVPLTHQYDDRNRGLGLVEMAFAVEQERPHRASGALASHVLEVMLSLAESSADGRYRVIESRPERPSPLPPGRARNPFLA